MKSPVYYLELACRYYLCAVLIRYGWAKILNPFHGSGQLPEYLAGHTTGQPADLELAWLFSGHVYLYIFSMGLMQVTGALLLLFNRTKLIGMAILLLVLLNMLVVEDCFGTSLGALFSACLYLCLLLALIFMNREQVKNAWRALRVWKPRLKVQWSELLLTVLLVTLMVIALVAAEQCVYRFFTQ